MDTGPINSFTGDYRFLSNFWPCKIEHPEDYMIYPSVEHAYQASKSADLRTRCAVLKIEKPGAAKRWGQTIKIREDWEDVKKIIMFRLLLAKFTQDGELGAKLIETGDRLLIEGNGWGDTYWGMVSDGTTWEGHNYLGRLLMAVRTVIE
jgi:ribA/ribD-fused uncharacterized protein